MDLISIQRIANEYAAQSGEWSFDNNCETITLALARKILLDKCSKGLQLWKVLAADEATYQIIQRGGNSMNGHALLAVIDFARQEEVTIEAQTGQIFFSDEQINDHLRNSFGWTGEIYLEHTLQIK